MVDRLRAKPGGEDIPVVIGDMTATRVDGSFDLVYLVFNTIGNLTEQDAQVACFDNAAHHLRPGGVFVIETEVPGVRWLPPTESFRVFHHGEDHVGIDEYEPATQGMFSHHYLRQADGSYVRRSLAVPLRLAGRARPDGSPRRPAVARTLGGLVAYAVHRGQRVPRLRLGEAHGRRAAWFRQNLTPAIRVRPGQRLEASTSCRLASILASSGTERRGQLTATTTRGPAAPASVQAWLHSASGSTRWSTDTSPSGGERQHRGQRLGPLLGRDRVVGVAQDAETPAAQGGRGEVRKVVGRSTQVDQPAPWSQRQRGRRGRLPENRVDHDVHRAPGRLDQPRGQRGRSSAGSSTTTSWAPHSCARAAAESDRHTATTRSAPRSRATANAT